MKKIAEFWELHGDKKTKSVQCHICAHHCIIPLNKRGFCQTRKNFDGTLYTLIYGSLIGSGSIDPIEKKPLYHFFPNSNAFSIATIGCSLRCQHCQNWHLSKSFPNEDGTVAQFSHKDIEDLNAKQFHLLQLSAEEVIHNVKRTNSTVIAYTYNEPLIWFEFVRDTALLAKKEGIKNVLVTGGYSSLETNREYIKFIDAANIDIKGFSHKFYKKMVGISDFKPILDTAKYFKENGIHVEITNLIIPNENDNMDEIKELIKWVYNKLGPETPLHFSAYHPNYRVLQPRTSSKLLQNAWKLAKEIGMHHVFMGNVLTNEGQDTVCPKCGEILIQRTGYRIKKKGLTKENNCSKCGEKIPIEGTFVS